MGLYAIILGMEEKHMNDVKAQLDRIDIMSRIDELTSLLDYVDECIRA
jgi:hypothetical protein